MPKARNKCAPPSLRSAPSGTDDRAIVTCAANSRAITRDGIRNAARKVPRGRKKKKKTSAETRARENGRPNLKRTSHGRGDCANTSVNASAAGRRSRLRRVTNVSVLPARARARASTSMWPRACACECVYVCGARVRVCVPARYSSAARSLARSRARLLSLDQQRRYRCWQYHQCNVHSRD